MAFVLPIISDCKNARSGKEQEWLEDLRMWACQLSDANMYQGRSNLMIPELHKQVEASVDQFQTGLFPNGEYLGCIPAKRTTAEEADDIRAAVFHELDHKNNLPAKSVRWQRQKVLYGTAFYKTLFEKKMRTVFQKRDKTFPEQSQIPIFQGVRIVCQDTFHTYCWPETAQNEQEAMVVFDEMFIPRRTLEQEKIYANLSKVLDIPQENSTLNWIDSVRLSIANLGSATSFMPTAVLVHEVWCDFNIKGDEWVPCVITIANMSTPIRIQRNPYWHQMKPYAMGRYMEGPAGELYGHSLPEKIRSLGYMMNDLGNQTMDSLNFALNPIALIDPGFVGDIAGFKLQPGARWFASPQGVQFANFTDVSQSGFAGMNQVRQMIQQFSDTAPSVAPQLQGKVRSATQTAAIQNEMSEALRNMVRNDEMNVMTQLAYFTHQLLQQYQTDEYQVVTQGPEHGQWILKPIRPAILEKDVVFFWKGSSVASKDAVRNQQLLNAFNLATQMEALMPGTVDLPKLYKEVLYQNFNIKELAVFKSDEDKKTVDPDIENLGLREGEEVDVNLGDNDDFHIESHGADFKENAETGASKVAFLRHLEKHKVQKQAKDALREQTAKLMAMKAMEGSLGQQGGGGEAQFAKEGNPYQASNPASESDLMGSIRPNPNMRSVRMTPGIPER